METYKIILEFAVYFSKAGKRGRAKTENFNRQGNGYDPFARMGKLPLPLQTLQRRGGSLYFDHDHRNIIALDGQGQRRCARRGN